MALSDWVDIETIKALSKHASGVVPSLLFFWVVGSLVDEVVRDKDLKHTLHLIDGIILVGLVLWLAFQTACIL